MIHDLHSGYRTILEKYLALNKKSQTAKQGFVSFPIACFRCCCHTCLLFCCKK